MAASRKSTTPPAVVDIPPKCVAIFEKGVENSRQLVSGLTAALADVASGRITNGRANAIANLSGKVLTTVKLEQQYGAKGAGQNPTLDLAGKALLATSK